MVGSTSPSFGFIPFSSLSSASIITTDSRSSTLASRCPGQLWMRHTGSRRTVRTVVDTKKMGTRDGHYWLSLDKTVVHSSNERSKLAVRIGIFRRRRQSINAVEWQCKWFPVRWDTPLHSNSPGWELRQATVRADYNLAEPAGDCGFAFLAQETEPPTQGLLFRAPRGQTCGLLVPLPCDAVRYRKKDNLSGFHTLSATLSFDAFGRSEKQQERRNKSLESQSRILQPWPCVRREEHASGSDRAGNIQSLSSV